MGIVLSFPATSPTRRDPRFRNLSQTIPDFVRQLKFFQKLADESFQKLAEAPLSVALDRLETALADIDAIGRLLPPGEFKTRFDLDRSALATQLDLAKGRLVGFGCKRILFGNKRILTDPLPFEGRKRLLAEYQAQTRRHRKRLKKRRPIMLRNRKNN